LDGGASQLTLKQAGGWKSDTVAEGYIRNSKHQKISTANLLAGQSIEEQSIGGVCCIHISKLCFYQLFFEFPKFSQINKQNLSNKCDYELCIFFEISKKKFHLFDHRLTK
jgi:hypothetical protein